MDLDYAVLKTIESGTNRQEEIVSQTRQERIKKSRQTILNCLQMLEQDGIINLKKGHPKHKEFSLNHPEIDDYFDLTDFIEKYKPKSYKLGENEGLKFIENKTDEIGNNGLLFDFYKNEIKMLQILAELFLTILSTEKIPKIIVLKILKTISIIPDLIKEDIDILDTINPGLGTIMEYSLKYSIKDKFLSNQKRYDKSFLKAGKELKKLQNYKEKITDKTL